MPATVTRTALKAFFEPGDEPTSVEFQTVIDSLASTNDANFMTGSLQVGALLEAPMFHTTNGTDLADDTAAITLTYADSGKTFLCALDGVAKTVNLPAAVTTDIHVGATFTIVQSAALVASGVLTINANTGNTWCLNSFAIGNNSSAGVVTRPADANNTIVITGANTNSAWGAGSRAIFTLVAQGEWHFQLLCEPLGTGNDAIAFSTT